MTLARSIKSSALRGIMALERAFAGSKAQEPLPEITNFFLLQHATALGTIVHATPLIAALKSAVPASRIVVAASGMSLDIFRHNPHLEALIETPSPLTDLAASASALRKLNPFRGETFATITTTGNERTRIALQAILGRAGNRVGMTVAPELYRVPIHFDRALSQIENNLRILGALGHKVPHNNFEPQVFFSEDDLTSAQRMIHHPAQADEPPVAVFVTQTSATQRKGWRAERFQAAATTLHKRFGAHIVFVGAANEAAPIDAIRSGLAFPTRNVAGQTSLPQLAALLSLCDVGLTLDTGTMHLGRAVGLPMVVIAPAWSPPVEWLPLGDPRYRILKNLDLPAAPTDYVIDEVTVGEVNEALADLLLRYQKHS